MNAFKNNNFNTILIVVLIVLNMASLYFLVFQKGSSSDSSFPKHRRDQGGAIEFLQKELGLTEDQVLEFNRLKREHHETSRALRENMHQLKKSLFDNLGNQNFDLQKLADSIGMNHSRLDIATYNHFRQLRSVCNKEQKQKFDQLIHRVARSMAPNPPSGRPPRHRPF